MNISFDFSVFQEEQKVPNSPATKEISKEEEDSVERNQDDKNKIVDVQFTDWRYGPAKLFYDSMDIPSNCKNFTYGFKLRDEVNRGSNLL